MRKWSSRDKPPNSRNRSDCFWFGRRKTLRASETRKRKKSSCWDFLRDKWYRFCLSCFYFSLAAAFINKFLLSLFFVQIRLRSSKTLHQTRFEALYSSFYNDLLFLWRKAEKFFARILRIFSQFCEFGRLKSEANRNEAKANTSRFSSKRSEFASLSLFFRCILFMCILFQTDILLFIEFITVESFWNVGNF